MKTKVNLLFTVDVDNDECVSNNERTVLRWTSIGRIPAIREFCGRHRLCVTWFVRADNQLREMYGRATFLLEEHRPLWQDLENAGDEIAWHPHLYHRSPPSLDYLPDVDESRCVHDLEATHQELQAYGTSPSSVRIGEAFQSNAIMAALDRVGLSVDSTALPGIKRQDKFRTFDWAPTPNEPYHPSNADYRVPDVGNPRAILEVPMTTMLVKAGYDAYPRRRYINPAVHHHIFKEAFDRHVQAITARLQKEVFLTTIFHPEEVLATASAHHPLYAFSMEEVAKNVAYLLRTLESHRFEFCPIRMKDVPRLWSVRVIREKPDA